MKHHQKYKLSCSSLNSMQIPMDLDQRRRSSIIVLSDQLLNKIQHLRSKVQQLAPDAYDEELFDRLQKDLPAAKEYAPSLDFENIECNGVRMLVRHAESYLNVAVMKRKPDEMRDCMHIIRLIDFWCSLLIPFRELQTSDSAHNKDEARWFYHKIYANYDPSALRVALSPQYHIVETPGLKFPYALIERAIIFTIAKKAKDTMKTFTMSRKTVAKTLSDLAPGITVRDVANVVRKLNAGPVRAVYAATRYATAIDKPVSVKKIKMTVPTLFKLSIIDNEVVLKPSTIPQDNPVKFYVLQHGRAKEFTNKLLFYVHGGAFVGPKAGQLNNFYLKAFCNHLKGLKILSMDYSPAPEAPFPVAVQQILDTYLWLTSGREEVYNTIGFYPSEIVLLGDSSGGNMIASLTVILNELRNMGLGFKPFMPRSMVLCFPKASLQFDIFPSLCISVIDPILSIQLMLAACISYVPMLKRDENGNWNLVEDNSTIPMDFLTREEYKVVESPFLSPVRYSKLDQLADVNLHVMAVANDPLLDESIEMARQWKGRTKLDVVEGVTHGAFIFNYFSKIGSKCVPLTTDIIRQAFFD